jgi:guanine nucleotide-binding protein subunit alpha
MCCTSATSQLTKPQRYSELVNAAPDIGTEEPIPEEFLPAFNCLWADKGVQLTILKGNQYALHDNLSYFFQDIERLFAKDFLPTDQDILRTRLRTTGISETIFELGNLTYKMVDVGGQRSERKKWIHVFDNVQVVLFLVAISGYDHVLVEDRNGNQMHEALMLFESISNSKYFERSAREDSRRYEPNLQGLSRLHRAAHGYRGRHGILCKQVPQPRTTTEEGGLCPLHECD